ncbi:hypothetical protein [Synechococcus sp. MIT S9503]|uniref:hypothetical protein n=1 Tax=Synechococcus sp. MIT S9503 TaxID=3082547 RepID=UPI0039A67FC2|tara:strand:- start:405 stop:902 length:498 start_codon:yes stop_codon:yes gene_type:complete
MPVLRFLLLPLRAPLVIVLFVVSMFLGHHWAIQETWLAEAHSISVKTFWALELIQAVVVVVICTMPDLLLRQLSLLMASSRVLSLVVTLTLLITVGLYVLSLSLLSDVLILGSATLLARLDLSRIKVVPPPQLTAFWLGVIVIAGIWIGHGLPSSATSLGAAISG